MLTQEQVVVEEGRKEEIEEYLGYIGYLIYIQVLAEHAVMFHCKKGRKSINISTKA